MAFAQLPDDQADGISYGRFLTGNTDSGLVHQRANGVGIECQRRLQISLRAKQNKTLAMPFAALYKLGDDILDDLQPIDLSASMEIEDLVLSGRYVNRLEVIKNVVSQFIERRKGDRVGLVLFGTQAYLQTLHQTHPCLLYTSDAADE